MTFTVSRRATLLGLMASGVAFPDHAHVADPARRPQSYGARADGQTDDSTALDFAGCCRPRSENCGWEGPFIEVTDAEDSARFSARQPSISMTSSPS